MQSCNTFLRMVMNTLILRSIADALTLYGFLWHASKSARERYARKIVDAFAGVESVEHCYFVHASGA